MAAALLVTIAVALIVVASLGGSPEARTSVGRVFVLALPLFVIAGAAIVPAGVVWWSALLMALATAVGTLLAGSLGSWLDAMPPRRTALAAAVMAGRSLVVVVLAAVAVRWLAPIIGSMTNLSALAVAIVVIAAAAAATVFAGGRFGLAKAAFLIAAVVAVLFFIAGIVLGTPGRTLDPVVPVAGPGPVALVAGLIGAALAGAVHPGLSALGREQRSVLTRGAVATGLVGLAGLLGLLWIAGGSLEFPSNALVTLTGYIAFAPSLVGGALAALVAAVLTIIVAAALEAALAPWDGREEIQPGGWFAQRWFAVLAAGVGVYLLSVSMVSGGWLLGTVGAVSAAVVLLRSRSTSASPVEPEPLEVTAR